MKLSTRNHQNQDRAPAGAVAIVVLNWRAPKDTIACIHSLQRQKYVGDHLLIVVDNGSDDGSEQQFREDFDDVVVLQTGSNLGFGGGVNVGINYALAAGYDWVWLLNNDTEVSELALTGMMNAIGRAPDLGILGSAIVDFHDSSKVMALGGGTFDLKRGRAGHVTKAARLGQLNYITGASAMLNSRMLREIGLFDEQRFFMYWEDTDLSARARNAGWQLAVAQDVEVRHYESKSSGGPSPKFYYMYTLSAIKFFHKHTGSHKAAMRGRARDLRRLLKKGELRSAWAVIQATRQGIRDCRSDT